MGRRDQAERPTNARFVFLAFAAALSLILYLDRICISESAKAIQAELGLDKFLLGLVFSAFTVGYTLFEVPSGAWGDRSGARRVLCRTVLWWSLFTALTGCVGGFTLDSGWRLGLPGLGWEVPLLVNGFVVLLAVRFLFGVGEAGAYPNLAKCSGRWFPLRERGFARGFLATAGRVGGGLAAGATVAVTAGADSLLKDVWPGAGWRVAFWLFGLLGVAWAMVFVRWFRDSPAEHPAVNAAELALIREGAAAPERGGADGHPAGIPWRALLRSTNLWAYSVMGFGSAFAVYLYFTHFPSYLKERHHFGEKWGWVAAGLPMICGAVACTLGGVLTDWLVRRTGSRRWGRRLIGLAGKGGAAVLLFLGACADDPVWAVALIALSAFASDLALGAHWAVATDTGGRYVATVYGFMNMVAGVGAALSPVVAGYALERLSPTGTDGVFDPAAREYAWTVVLCVFAAVLAVTSLCWLRIDAEESMVGE
jgi:MFS transporter, ACS family, glucarate transporter